MKISAARVIVCSPGRNFVTLKVTTDQGVYGIGDATLNGRELAVVSYLRDHVVPALIGRDPARIEDTWQYLYKGAYWRRGPVTMTAISAVDTALWDIKGKVAGLPLYQLLGGRSRDGVTVYAHAGGTYGVRKGEGIYEPAATALPEEQPWDTEAYLGFAPTYLEAVRERFGFGFHLLHDVHHRLSPI